MKFSDFIEIEIKDNIAICWFDHKLEKMNIVSPAVIGLFEELAPKVIDNDEVHAVILISRKPDFMAGADIKSFQIEKKGDFRPFQIKGHEALERLEQSRKPIVAAISGSCVGLGTELALACHARIATNSPRTKMGLPEVKLGILPGGGGTQRLPRLIGIQKALDMMLTGKLIDAHRAKKWGLVDEVTDEGKLLQAATIMAKRLMKVRKTRKPKLSFTEKLLESPLGRGMLFGQARKIAMKQSQGNYPAIPAILDCVETGIRKGLKAGYEKEVELFEMLMLTPQSRGLRSLFFAMNGNKKNPYDGAKSLNTLGMIGAGFMGAGIAQVSATKGINVLLKDINQSVIDSAYKLIWKNIAKKIKFKAITKMQAEQQISNVNGQLTYENFNTADIVIEAVLEKMSLKKQIIKDIEEHGKSDVIIATNTSSLSVTEMAANAQKPEMVIGMHYFSPVPKMPLLEIVKTKDTADWVIASCYEMGLQQGKTVVVVKDGPGFYVNRILAPYTNECLTMLDEGLGIEVVDKAMLKKGFPVGPITLLDEVGLDIAAHVTESSREFAEAKIGFTVNDAAVRMHKDGRQGKKNGKGFFVYNEKGKKQGVDKSAYKYFKGNGEKSLAIEDIQDRGVMLMLNEAVLCLEDGIIANVVDGDLAAVFGIGFLPFTGGPFRMMDEIGISKVVDRMNVLKATYGERFTPAKTLIKMAALNSTFH